jgi:DNA-binding transcriptional regulator YiaG
MKTCNSACFLLELHREPGNTINMKTLTSPANTSWTKARTNGKQLFELRRSLGIPRPLFSTIADVSERSLASYETNPKLPASVRPRLNEALRLLKALLDILPAEDLRTWLTQPNPGFQGETPLHLIKTGEKDRIWAMIHQTRIGAYS